MNTLIQRLLSSPQGLAAVNHPWADLLFSRAVQASRVAKFCRIEEQRLQKQKKRQSISEPETISAIQVPFGRVDFFLNHPPAQDNDDDYLENIVGQLADQLDSQVLQGNIGLQSTAIPQYLESSQKHLLAGRDRESLQHSLITLRDRLTPAFTIDSRWFMHDQSADELFIQATQISPRHILGLPVETTPVLAPLTAKTGIVFVLGRLSHAYTLGRNSAVEATHLYITSHKLVYSVELWAGVTRPEAIQLALLAQEGISDGHASL